MHRERLLEHYTQAKDWVVHSQYRDELAWQRWALENRPDETRFLREYAWVVLNSGFRESVVRRHFDYLSLCFCDWASAGEIVENAESCFATAIEVFSNDRKISSLIRIAELIHAKGFEQLWSDLQEDPLNRLEELPFIGEVTKWHLAKNLGFDVAKPDRHLIRLANRFGYSCVQQMCVETGEHSGDPIAIVDLVLWRHAEQSAVH